MSSDSRLKELAANRIAFEGIGPEIDGGRFAARVALHEDFIVEADIFGDGHDVIDAAIVWRPKGSEAWTEVPMAYLENDRWLGSIRFPEMGPYDYSFVAWRNLFATWRNDTAKKVAAGQKVSLEIVEGMQLVEAAAKRKDQADHDLSSSLKQLHKHLTKTEAEAEKLALLMEDATSDLMRRGGVRTNLSRYERELPVEVDSPLAAFGAWYELMPRSQGPADRHGTFDDVIARLPYVRDLGFDILYFTPIHPIGRTNRKGPNNSLVASPDDPGSPYAIGSDEGGHDALHPQLGTFDDFAHLPLLVEETSAVG